jgi:hypothetical protein
MLCYGLHTEWSNFQDGKMADSESSGDPIAILEKVSAQIDTARKARGLLDRLQLAEREAAELADLVVIARKP